MLKKRNWVPILFILPALLMVLIFMYIPIIMNFYYSGFRMSAFSTNPEFVGLNNYIEIFKDPVFYTALKNNALFAIISVVMQCFFGLILAMILESRFVGKIKKAFQAIYFIPAVISVSAVGMLWTFLYEPNMGLFNSILKVLLDLKPNEVPIWLGNAKTAMGCIIVMSQWQYVGYITVLLVVAIQKIPIDLYEAADIDGANGFQKSWFITVPQVKEMLLVTIVITVIGAFKVFTEVYVTTLGGPGQASHVLGTYLYNQGFINNRLGYASAIGTIAFIITFAFSILQLKLSKSGEE